MDCTCPWTSLDIGALMTLSCRFLSNYNPSDLLPLRQKERTAGTTSHALHVFLILQSKQFSSGNVVADCQRTW
jgi:hypothetical protein